MEEKEILREQEILDSELLKNAGDKRYIKQKGSITLKDGTKKEIDLEIERKRNENGGVDVKVNILTPFSVSGKVQGK